MQKLFKILLWTVIFLLSLVEIAMAIALFSPTKELNGIYFPVIVYNTAFEAGIIWIVALLLGLSLLVISKLKSVVGKKVKRLLLFIIFIWIPLYLLLSVMENI